VSTELPEPAPQTAGYLVVFAPAPTWRSLGEGHTTPYGEPEYARQLAGWHDLLGLTSGWRYRGVDRQIVERALDIDARTPEVLRVMHEESTARLKRAVEHFPGGTEEERKEAAEILSFVRSAGVEIPDERAYLLHFARTTEAQWPEWIPEAGRHASGPDPEAQGLLADLLGPDPGMAWHVPEGYDSDLAPELEMARQVLAACHTASEREIIRIARRGQIARGPVLGYDVAEWGSRMSAVRDCIVAPRWHPPDDDALPHLRQVVALLNEHLLFPSLETAEAYAAWYRAQPWGETAVEDENPFQPIAVESAQ
jgi:hypothetical protein